MRQTKPLLVLLRERKDLYEMRKRQAQTREGWIVAHASLEAIDELLYALRPMFPLTPDSL